MNFFERLFSSNKNKNYFVITLKPGTMTRSNKVVFNGFLSKHFYDQKKLYFKILKKITDRERCLLSNLVVTRKTADKKFIDQISFYQLLD